MKTEIGKSGKITLLEKENKMKLKFVSMLFVVLVLGACGKLDPAPEQSAGLKVATQVASFQGIGDIAGSGSYALAVSGDGATVVGYSKSGPLNEPFRWTQAGGMESLGDLPGGTTSGVAYDVSANGSFIVGQSDSSDGPEAFLWSQGNGMVGLGDLPGGLYSSAATGVSADGSVIVGRGFTTEGVEAFRWTQGYLGMVGLSDLPRGDTESSAQAVSADGTVTVGTGNSQFGREAARWYHGLTTAPLIGLGDFPGGVFESVAFAVSDDGTVIAGYGKTAIGQTAFRWTKAGGMEALNAHVAFGASADGSTIVGTAYFGASLRAMIWDEMNGVRNLKTLLENYGLDLAGWTLHRASDVSSDGSVIVGWGINPAGDLEAWRAEVPPLNTPPVADAGSNYAGTVGVPTHLDGSASFDADGDALSYSWSVNSPSCTLSNALTAKPSVTCNTAGDYAVMLTVTDEHALSDDDAAELTVIKVKKPKR